MIRDTLLEKRPLTESNLYPDTKKGLLSDAEISPTERESVSLLLDEEPVSKGEDILRPRVDKSEWTPLKPDDAVFEEEIAPVVRSEPKAPSYGKPLLIPLCQIHDTYIVCQGEDGFYLIDQHAAQERVNYEKLDRQLNSRIATTDLLVPLILSVGPGDMIRLKERLELLKQVGISAEIFGINTIRVTSVPLFVKENNEEVYVEELIEQVISKERIDLSELRKKMISTFACKASIKANHRLSIREMQDVIDSLFRCANPTCCPHGRPTIVHFSKYDIEKMFKRSGI